jgi:stage II sporulation protein D
MRALRGGWICAVLVLAGCGGRPVAKAALASDPLARAVSGAVTQTVRVGLQVGVPSVEVQAAAAYRLLGIEAGQRTVRTAGTLRARVDGGRIVIEDAAGRVTTSATEILLQASASTTWTIGGDRFDGDLVLRLVPTSGLVLVNHLPIETYLRGVVPWEIGRPGDDALEAVKAQAIAARTYTYAHLGQWTRLGFDVHADTRDQVYRGLTGTAPITDRAVRETAHRVAVYRGELIRAYYSSTSGGHGATLTDVWRREGADYLRGRRDADASGRSFCADSPHFRWTETWSARELGEAIRSALPTELGRALTPEQIGVVQNVEVVDRDGSGRVRLLRITTDRDRFEVWGDRIRWVLKPPRSRFAMLRSTMFNLENIEREGKLVGLIARGGGFGHGVGMCQTGALGRARAGQDAATILRAYYAGIDVVDVRSLEPRARSR